jgi:hypothetical protein
MYIYRIINSVAFYMFGHYFGHIQLYFEGYIFKSVKTICENKCLVLKEMFKVYVKE